MRRLAWIVVFCGCTGPERSPEPDTGDPFVPFEGTEPVAEWTAEQFGAKLGQLVDFGFPNSGAVSAQFAAFMAHGNEICPGHPTQLTADTILGCASPDGYWFSGVGGLEQGGGDGPDGKDVFHAISGDFELRYPTGEVFEAGGGLVYHGVTAPDGSQQFDMDWRGTWRDATQPGWLGSGTSGLFSAVGGRDPSGRRLDLDGGIGIGDVDAFVDLGWNEAETCGWSPTGEVRLRDGRGYWYVWDLGEDCDACGEVVFHGDQPLGEVCFSFAPYGDAIFATLTVPQ